MTRLPRLYVVMLRYRIATMVAMFMLVGAAREGTLRFSWEYVFGLVALGSSYVAATAMNDLADEEIDRVNHPRDAGRPLVEGTASRRDLHLLHAVAALLALASSLPLGGRGIAIVLLSLTVSQAYSARPIRFSYRTYLAPVALAVAYVFVPYAIGIVAAHGGLEHAGTLLPCALFVLFVARIVLKDFRDREGDAVYGKPTLLLRFGKTATCAVSFVALVAADALLVAALHRHWGVAALLQPFVAGIAWLLQRLWRAGEARDEQIAIGIGARLGNGLLLSLLGFLVLQGGNAPPAHELVFLGALGAVFLAGSAALIVRPREALIGYKG